MSRFTLHRVRNKPWKFWPMVGLVRASTWQLIDHESSFYVYLSIATLVGCLFVLLSLVLANKRMSQAVEKWAYIAIIWSMSCYLAVAVSDEGWRGLVMQPNLGIVLSECVVLAALHNVIWGLISPRIHDHKVKVQAKALIVESTLGTDSTP